MTVRGRFAPSPSGRMHLGNLMAALLAWLDVRSQNGVMVLRIEDLDPERCTREKAAQLVEDLEWLGLDWDEGGLIPSHMQSCRGEIYAGAFERLTQLGLTYPCYCTRAERLAVGAPHREDGTVVYSGRCAGLSAEQRQAFERAGRKPAWRVRVPDEDVTVEDGHMGAFSENLRRDCGDFIIRRSDGAWAYQLAVVVDDALMGINHVVRGSDLLSSSPRQAWLHRVLGYEAPQFYHLPLLTDSTGRRLSKRDADLDLSVLRQRYTPEELTGRLAFSAGLLEEYAPVSPRELVSRFDWRKVPTGDLVVKEA
ncbi:MAG: tRNA glutamyl-Q(34) synthetase GluQRS [Oscillospiraceae bacterium]|nr:tRNA glutamyl-Q(34) synthetase GluQRS [Oscillospiraceae bacterium]